MLRHFAVIVIGLFGFGTIALAQPAVGTLAPDFTLNSMDGSGPVTLSSFQGEVVLLDFFGATCGDCLEDAPLVQDIYLMFNSNPDFNIIGIDVWNLPAPYVNATFRAQTGVTFTLLANGRNTGYAYNMEVDPVPSAIDNEHRGYLIVDRQGVIQNYWIFNPWGVDQQQEIIQALQVQLDPCYGIDELDAPQQLVIMLVSEDSYKLCWNPVQCATRFNVFRTVTQDWANEILVGTTTTETFDVNINEFETALYRVVAIHE